MVTTINWGKQSTPVPDEEGKKDELSDSKADYLQERHNEVQCLCKGLSKASTKFDVKDTYESVEKYIEVYERWFYSDISNYLFECAETGVFLTNLDSLQAYSYELLNEKKDNTDAKMMVSMIDKLWDHANLAQMQRVTLCEDDDTFKVRFENNIAPFTASFSRDMNKQLISLIAIFTALSFIVFGGISSLDNLFEGAKSIPIIQLVIIGVIWSFCILNLVFVFMFFIAKLTQLSIKSDDDPKASLSKKYPFIIWCDFILLHIMAIFSWLYYVDYSNSGSWLIRLSQRYEVLSTLIGILIIIISFVCLAAIILKKRKEKSI